MASATAPATAPATPTKCATCDGGGGWSGFGGAMVCNRCHIAVPAALPPPTSAWADEFCHAKKRDAWLEHAGLLPPALPLQVLLPGQQSTGASSAAEANGATFFSSGGGPLGLLGRKPQPATATVTAAATAAATATADKPASAATGPTAASDNSKTSPAVPTAAPAAETVPAAAAPSSALPDALLLKLP